MSKIEVTEVYRLNADELHALADHYLRMLNECKSEIIDRPTSMVVEGIGGEPEIVKIEELKRAALKEQKAEIVKKLSYFIDESLRLIELEKEAKEAKTEIDVAFEPELRRV